MPQDVVQCKKCKKIMEGYRYCISCGSHLDDQERIVVYTQKEVDVLLKKNK